MPTDEELCQRAADIRSKARGDHDLRQAAFLDQLAEGEEGQKLRSWFEQQQREGLNAPDPMLAWIDEVERSDVVDTKKLDDGIQAARKRLRIPCDEFGEPIAIDPIDEMVSLARWATSVEPLSPWEALPEKQRARWIASVINSANRLAGLLERTDRPALPQAIELFDPKNTPPPLRSRLANANDPKFLQLQPVWDQEMAPMLRRLAEVAEREQRLRVGAGVREARPKTGRLDERVLARDLAVWFERRYGHPPIARIVDIVFLLTGTATDDPTVTQWLEHK
jgi:hypothetical protein